jgi:hypothetical protein
MLVIIGGHIRAQHPQVRLLDDVIHIRRLAEDAIDIRAERARRAGMESRERRLIETAHAYSVETGGSWRW